MNKLSWPVSFFLSVVVVSLTLLIIEKDIVKLMTRKTAIIESKTDPISPPQDKLTDQEVMDNALAEIKEKIRREKCLIDWENEELFVHAKFHESVKCFFDVMKRKKNLIIDNLAHKIRQL